MFSQTNRRLPSDSKTLSIVYTEDFIDCSLSLNYSTSNSRVWSLTYVRGNESTLYRSNEDPKHVLDKIKNELYVSEGAADFELLQFFISAMFWATGDTRLRALKEVQEILNDSESKSTNALMKYLYLLEIRKKINASIQIVLGILLIGHLIGVFLSLGMAAIIALPLACVVSVLMVVLWNYLGLSEPPDNKKIQTLQSLMEETKQNEGNIRIRSPIAMVCDSQILNISQGDIPQAYAIGSV